jgi:subtilisin family serine protease
MTPGTVVRRFELHAADTTTLADVGTVLRNAQAAPAPDRVTVDPGPPYASLLTSVRLTGRARPVSQVLAALTSMPGVRIVHERIQVKEDRHGGNGHGYPDRRALALVGVEPSDPGEAKLRPPGAPVVVAVVDSGIMVDHPVLRYHLWTSKAGIHGRRFIDGVVDDDITDRDGHGTMLAGSVIAAADRAPAISIMTAKFFDAETPAHPRNAAAAIDFAVERGADIINLSWSLGLGSSALAEAIERAASSTALVVVAAGNYGTDNDKVLRAPPKYVRGPRPNVITVMATDASDRKAWFSNYGRTTVDLAAPGVGIVSTRRLLFPRAGAGASLQYRPFSGTSAAAALVSGAAALLKSRTGLAAKDLKDCLMDTADWLPSLKGKCVRGGRLNIGRALTECA